MHQPSYLDPESGELAMPWVRLHAIKDYFDMGRAVEEIPGATAVFNFVPSLWEQLDKIASGEWQDQHEEVCRKPASELTADERFFVAQHFFSCPYDTMIAPHPPYRELYYRFGPQGNPRSILTAGDASVIDLQVWYHLAWCGHTLRETPLVRRLIEKGRRFTFEEKIELLDAIRDFIREIPLFYKRLAGAGKAEISTTPYYHPILPLLLNPDSAEVACPGLRLPRERMPLEADADKQVGRAIAYHERLFGSRPAGFWPSEGSVSPETTRLFARHGVRWIATDEEVLRLSLGKAELTPLDRYRVYQHEGVCLFFRDHDLSDRIGFHYAATEPHAAVENFLARLREIRKSLPAAGDFVVPVILDGENCWEFYKDQGWPFLTELYHRIAADPDFEITTCGKVVEQDAAQAVRLHHLHSGSWIFANFTTWIGDPVKNKAWSYLYEARRTAEIALKSDSLSSNAKEELEESILAAEGSDWFWWFGEGHTSAYDSLFDELFRHRLKTIYRLIGQAAPEHLSQPVDDRWTGARRYTLPTYRIRPRINGKVGSYYEWLAAGACYPQAGAMQRAQVRFAKLLYGFDDDNLYFRLESPLFGASEMLRDASVEIVFTAPTEKRFSIPLGDAGAAQSSGFRTAKGRCVDAAIRFSSLKDGFTPGEEIAFYVALNQDGREVERLPETMPIVLPFPTETFDDENWYV